MAAAKFFLCAALLVGLSAEARALCRDDLQDLKPRIDRIKKTSPMRYNLALKWWGDAQEAAPGSETECLNFLAKARKALVEPLTQPVDCTGQSVYQQICQNVGSQLGFPVGPVQPIGGGAAGGQKGPTPSGGRAVPFNPPGSVMGGQGVQATGTDR